MKITYTAGEYIVRTRDNQEFKKTLTKTQAKSLFDLMNDTRLNIQGLWLNDDNYSL